MGPHGEALLKLAVERSLLTPEQAERARRHCSNGARVEQALLDLKLLSRDELAVLIDQFRASAPETKLLYGRYRVLGALGRGALAAVYRVHDQEMNRVVALKRMELAPLMGAQTLERFFREVRAAAKLRHPNIVAIHDVGRDATSCYFTMDCIDGKSLRAHMRAGKLPRRRALEWIAQIADAVAHAHANNVLHRDIKPENTLVDAAGCAWLADFGLARDLEEEHHLTITGVIVGTPLYMSPEQAAGRADARSDVYSLGATLYEVVTGYPPYVGASIVEVLQRLQHEDAMPPRARARNVPLDLETIILKAIEKDPARRYASAADFRDDLRRFLDGEAILARRPSWPERLWRHARRRRLLYIGSAALTLAVLVAGYALSRAHEAERFRDVVAEREQRRAQARPHFERGRDALARAHEWLPAAPDRADLERRYERAVAALEQATTLDADYAEAHYLIGTAKHELLQFDKAEQAYSRAIQADPEHALAYADRALAALEKCVSAAGRLSFELSLMGDASFYEIGTSEPPPKEALARARADLATAEKLRRQTAEWMAGCIQGLAAYAERRYAEAAKLLAAVVREAPALYVARLCLGYALFFERRPDEARNEFDIAVHLRNADPRAYEGRALCEAALNRANLALKDFDRAQQLAPDNAELHLERAAMNQGARAFQRALDDCDLALKTRPGWPAALLLKALTLAYWDAVEGKGRARSDEALRIVNELTESVPALARAYLVRARIKSWRQLGESATADLDRAVELDPRDAPARLMRATYFGDPSKALEDLNAAIEIDPGLADAYLSRGRLHMRRGKAELAVADFEQFLKLAPRRDFVVKQELAEARRKAGKSP